jgi:hypothetical protein
MVVVGQAPPAAGVAPLNLLATTPLESPGCMPPVFRALFIF